MVNKIRGTFNSVAVKAPGFGERRKAMLADMAILTGGQVISEEVGLKLDSTTLDLLGQARKIVVTKDETTIVEGAGSPAEVDGRVAQIKREIDDTDSDWDREKLQERLAKLSGGVAVIKDGVIDPAKVTRSALQNAASIAALLLTTEALVADKPDDGAAAAAAAAAMGGMGGMGGMM